MSRYIVTGNQRLPCFLLEEVKSVAVFDEHSFFGAVKLHAVLSHILRIVATDFKLL
jgi:hypothetical protein